MIIKLKITGQGLRGALKKKAISGNCNLEPA
jgi:hypothetical protein